MKQINKYGAKLQSDFCTKAKIQEDVDNGKFDGTWRYEKDIKTIEDAIGWMLETYDYEAYYVIDEWIEMEQGTVWGLDINTLKQELEKVFEGTE